MHAYFIHDATDPAPKVREHTSDPDQFVIEFGGDTSGYIHRDNLLALCASALHVLGEPAIYPSPPEIENPHMAPVEDVCDHCGNAVRQATAEDEHVTESIVGCWIHRDTNMFGCETAWHVAMVDGSDRPKTVVPS